MFPPPDSASLLCCHDAETGANGKPSVHTFPSRLTWHTPKTLFDVRGVMLCFFSFFFVVVCFYQGDSCYLGSVLVSRDTRGHGDLACKGGETRHLLPSGLLPVGDRCFSLHGVILYGLSTNISLSLWAKTTLWRSLHFVHVLRCFLNGGKRQTYIKYIFLLSLQLFGFNV